MSVSYEYRYFDPRLATQYITSDKCWVYFYRPDNKLPPRCVREEDQPADALSAVVAAAPNVVGKGELFFAFDTTKDPIPPPPPPPAPPPWRGDIVKYTTTDTFQKWDDALPRGTRA